MHDYSFLDDLNPKQKEICESEQNYVLTACPGSGKTRTITYRLAYLQQKYCDSRKYNVAITYTNRAAEEIEHRLDDMGIDLSYIWTGTIHQFCMYFIIRPYSMYSERLKRGYHIIDEYVTREYCKAIAAKFNIDIQRRDPFSFPQIKKEYARLLEEKKEIDFDSILQLSYQLICDNPFIAENIGKILRSVHVDEYQDTQEIQYCILSEIIKANPSINLLFVGDVNQAIYGTLGSVAKSASEIRSIYPIAFHEEELDGCYRSTQRLIDFYKQFEVHTTNAHSLARIRDLSGKIVYNATIHTSDLAEQIANIITAEISQGVPENEICIAAPQWYMIYPLSKALRALLPNVRFDSPDVSPFKYDRTNPFFLLAQLTFTAAGTHVASRKRIASEFIDILRTDYEITIPTHIDAYAVLKLVNASVDPTLDGIDCLRRVVSKLFGHLGIKSSIEKTLVAKYKAFLSKANQRINDFKIAHTYNDLCSFFKEKDGVVISTLHGTKGEEYHTVIVFGLLKGYLPHWDIVINHAGIAHNETLKLLYVICSRAKENLYLFSECGHCTQKGAPYTPTPELSSALCNYDSV